MTLAVNPSAKVRTAGAPVNVALAILAGAFLNGYFKPVSDWTYGLFSNAEFGLPVSLLDVLVMAVAVSLILPAGLQAPKPAFFPKGAGVTFRWPETLAAAAILVPSSAVSWAVAAGYASWRSIQLRPRERAGCVLLAGLALAQLWSTVFIKWFALPLGAADAALAAALLSAVFPGVARAANVVSLEGGHSIIVLCGCMTAYFLPKLLLVQAAVSLSLSRGKPGGLWRGLVAVAAFAALANGIRLALMATSPEYYRAIYSTLGGSVFDFLMIMAVFALTRWGLSS